MATFAFRLSGFDICDIDADTREIAQEQFATGIDYQSWEDLSEANAVDVTERVVASHDIELSIDTEYAEAFAAWLRARGHAVRIGRSTGSYIDGAWTSADCEANEIMRDLWDAYCNA